MKKPHLKHLATAGLFLVKQKLFSKPTPPCLRLALACMILASLPARATLLLEYEFDDYTNAAFTLDSSANPTNGFFSGTATRTAYGQAPLGQGYALNLVGSNGGVNNWLTVSNAAKLNPSGGLTNFTLSAWINLQAAPAASDRIFGKETSTSGFGLTFTTQVNSANPTASAFRLDLFVNSTSVGRAGNVNLNASNQWIFVAVTYNGTFPTGDTTDTNLVYYVGSLTSPVAISGIGIVGNFGPVTNNTSQLRIGSTPASGSDRTPPAWIDDVRIYDTVLASSDLETIREQNVPPSLSVSVSPQTTVIAGTNVIFTASTFNYGMNTPSYQWLFNSNDIPGATSSTYTITGVQSNNAGLYGVIVSNNIANITNNSTTLSVFTPYNASLLTNVWTVLPPQTTNGITWLNTINTERSMAFDALTTNLIIVSRTGTIGLPNVVALDALTGNFEGTLDTSAQVNGGYSGLFPLDQVAVASDGVIYAGNMTETANVLNYVLYSWQNEGSAQTVAYQGDPGAPNYPNLRWGDAMALRGSGTNTQILLSSADTNTIGTDTVFSVLSTVDGINFTSQAFSVTNLPGASANIGLAWGSGTNTLYAKSPGSTNQLYFIQFDLPSGFGFVRNAYTTNDVPGGVGPIGVNVSSNWLAGLDVNTTGSGYNVLDIYNIANVTNNPVLLVQTVTFWNTLNMSFEGVGSVNFGQIGGTNYLFVLDTDNGILAYQLGSLSVPLTLFNITGINVLPGDQVILTWQTIAGHTYQVQSKSALTDLTWSPLGGSVSATASSTTTTNATSGNTEFFQISGQ